MPRTLNVRRSVALTAAFVLTSWGAAVLPAAAEDGTQTAPGGDTSTQTKGSKTEHPKGGNRHGDDTDDDSTDGTETDGTDDDSTDGTETDDSTDGADGTGDTDDDGTEADGTDDSTDDSTDDGDDPAGNNGTVKVAPEGEIDSIPNNSPHPGCTFEIEWYGFDEGDDVVSTVTFAMQAPTRDVTVAVDGPESVFVGEDDASGAGTDTGLDGREEYALSFTGEPHPKQGYHVKLTVATPRSLGNDTKTKVFWVEPCEDQPTATETPATDDTDVLGTQASDDTQPPADDTEVLGTQAATEPSSSDVPFAVDAGEAGRAALSAVTASPWPLALAGIGSLLTLGALASRRRRRGIADSGE